MWPLLRQRVEAVCPRSQADCAEGFPFSDLQSHERRAVLALGCDHMASRIRHGNAQRLEAKFGSLGEDRFNDPVRRCKI